MSMSRLAKPNQLGKQCLSGTGILNSKMRTITTANGNNTGASANSKISSNLETVSDSTRFLNHVGNSRKPSLLREIARLTANVDSDFIVMAGGYPNSELFPFESIKLQMDSNTSFDLVGEELTAALQYQPSKGYPPLVDALKNMQMHYHNPPSWDKKDIIVTVGSQHGLSAVIEMTINHGDPVIVPQPVYSSMLTLMDPYSPVYLTVPTDSHGMQPTLLKSILDKWISSNSHEKRPKILYLNPTGTNPTGGNTTTERKKEIYKIAQEYDLLILEDDPYYFLHFDHENPTSILSMDVDGRVIRFDSFSKIISSGLRIGFVTGPSELIRRIELVIQASVLQASSLSQVLVHRILKQWSIDGFDRHTQKVRELYRKRRDLMAIAAKKHLEGLADWEIPQGGMFLWMKVRGVDDTYQMVMKHGMKAGIALLPGRECSADRNAPCPYLRAAFSIVTPENMDKGFERLAGLIRDEQKRQ